MRASLLIALAGIAFDVQVSPPTLEWPLARTGEVVVTVDTSDQEQVVGIAPSGPSWPGVDGSPLRYGRPVVEGPGTAMGFVHSGFGRLPISCARGALLPTGGQALRLPARSRTTLRYPVELSAPPWIGTDYAPAFSAVYPFEQGAVNPTRLTLRGPSFAVAGRTGVRVVLSSRPARRKIRRNRGLTILGRTEPRLANRRVRLTSKRMTSGPSPVEGRVGTVRTDDRGRFAYRWKPSALGLYAISADYGQDTSCGFEFYVRR